MKSPERLELVYVYALKEDGTVKYRTAYNPEVRDGPSIRASSDEMYIYCNCDQLKSFSSIVGLR